MALCITDDCINCGACETECPMTAIHPPDNDLYYYIDTEECNECVGFHDEPQCVLNCPVDAIIPC